MIKKILSVPKSFIALLVIIVIIMIAMMYMRVCFACPGESSSSIDSVKYVLMVRLTDDNNLNPDQAINHREDRIKVISHLDSILKVVNDNQAYIVKRQDDLINDIRQETNNNIDKLAVFSGIGICLIGLFGCLVPIWQSKISRDELERGIEEWKEGCFKNLDIKVDGKLQVVEKVIKDNEDSLRRMKRQYNLLKIQSISQCFNNALEINGVDNNSQLRLLDMELWLPICEGFSSLVTIIKDTYSKHGSEISNQKDDIINLREERIVLICILEDIDLILRRVVTRSSDPYTCQDIQFVRDSIRSVFNDISKLTFVFNNDVIESLEQLAREFAMLRIRF